MVELKCERLTQPVNCSTTFALVFLHALSNKSFGEVGCGIARMLSLKNLLERDLQATMDADLPVDAQASCTAFKDALADTTTHGCFTNVVTGVEQMFNLLFREVVFDH